MKYIDLVPYKPFTLEKASTRVGALDILKMPSRYNNLLVYPDGRVVRSEKK